MLLVSLQPSFKTFFFHPSEFEADGRVTERGLKSFDTFRARTRSRTEIREWRRRLFSCSFWAFIPLYFPFLRSILCSLEDHNGS